MSLSQLVRHWQLYRDILMPRVRSGNPRARHHEHVNTVVFGEVVAARRLWLHIV